MHFIHILPNNFASVVTYKNLINNYFYYLQQKKIKRSLLIKFRLLHKIFFDSLKILYLPISIIFYFTNFRFVQLNYLQVGTVCHHLSIMSKFQLQKNKKAIILIPSNHNFSFVLDIFKKNKNIIFIKSNFLYILFLPLIYTNFISSPETIADNYYDKNLKKIGKYDWSRIYLQKKFKGTTYFQLSINYLTECEKIFKNNFEFNDLNNTFIMHLRENNYNKTSDIRNCNITNYIEGINFLIKKNYNIIRIINSYDIKCDFGKNYHEVNIDLYNNKFLQFFLIYKSRGFICCNSGPAGIGFLLEKSLLQLNCVDVPIALTERSLYIPKLIKKDNITQNFYELWSKNKFIEYQSKHSAIRNNYQVIENSSDEILEAIKEFDLLLDKNKTISFNDQEDFKKKIVNKSYGHSIANISPFFFKKYNKLFY